MDSNEWNKLHRDRCRLAEERYRIKHPKEIREHRKGFRQRHSNYDKIQREKHKEAIYNRTRKWKKENKEKVHAENVVLHKPLAKNCEICGSTDILMKHHPDYLEPTMYITLCRSCHGYIHSERRKRQKP